MAEINTKSSGMTIFPKILIGIIVIVILPISVMLYLNTERLQEEMERNVEKNLQDTSALLATEINNWTDLNLRVLREHVQLKQIQSGIEEQQKPILDAILGTYEWTYLVYAIGGDGYKTARSDDQPILKEDGTKAHFRGDRDYFKQVQQRDFGYQVVLSKTINKPVFILCARLKKAPDAENYGALCMGMTLTSMSDIVSNTRIGETGYAILLDNTNKVIAHGQSDLIKEQLKNLSSHPVVAKGIDKGQLTFEEGDYAEEGTESKDTTKKVAYTQTVNQGWRLIVVQDYNEAYNAVISTKRNTLIVLVCTIVLSILLAWFLARRISQPIKQLTDIANDISRGKLHMQIAASDRGDEIGMLAQAVERMGVSISLAFNKLKKLQKEAKARKTRTKP